MRKICENRCFHCILPYSMILSLYGEYGRVSKNPPCSYIFYAIRKPQSSFSSDCLG